LKVGYDGNADDDIDDAGDDLVVSSPFGSTAITPSHDDNGNLTDDGTYKYTYDAWNRLVKATLNDTDITIQQAEFDGLGRRIKKTVTNSGDLDGTTVYLYNRHQIIETRNGSDEVTLQVYPGTRYIDEVVGLRVKDQGRLYAHQDANWNVTALTDLTGRVIEQYWYSPTGSSRPTSPPTPSTSTTTATWTPRTSQPGPAAVPAGATTTGRAVTANASTLMAIATSTWMTTPSSTTT
jgi:YD repeat-containing protein